MSIRNYPPASVAVLEISKRAGVSKAKVALYFQATKDFLTNHTSAEGDYLHAVAVNDTALHFTLTDY